MAATREDKRRGRREHAASHEGRVKSPNLGAFYASEIADIRPGYYEFSFDLLRSPRMSLDRFIESCEWTDESAVLEGSMTLRRPDPNDPQSLPFEHGYPVRCRVRAVGKTQWRELWRMRTGIPSTTVETGTVEVELKDDLDALRRNQRDWTFRRTKRRKRGYYAHEIAREVARREGVRLGRVAKGTKRMRKLVKKDATALDVLRAAYEHERKATGRRFVIRMTAGRLEIVPFQRNPILYVFGAQMQSALVSKTGPARPVTVLEAKGRIGKGKDAEKVKHTEVRRDLIRRFGYLHKEKNFGRVSSKADLRRQARREMAEDIRLKPSVEFDHAGVPYIRRGEGIYVHLASEGFSGEDEQSRKRAFVYIRSISHRVDSSGYSMSIGAGVDDPYLKDRKQREREEREKTRRKRKRRDN
ncbi:MAG: hypothetical protein LC798_13255 [Chloroflexi bacterium]|nr:hypothetical protein [Chloroflexota bacterium]